MITIKTTGYTTEALELLHQLLVSDINGLIETYCTTKDCKSCKYIRLCEDLYSTHDYVENLLKSRQGI